MECQCDGRLSNIPAMIRSHPLLAITMLAVVIRLILSPLLTYDYDIYHWAQTIENFQTGNGLYGIDAYYYTPTWGYILGFLSGFMDLFLNVGEFGTRFTELLPIEDLGFRFHTATTTNLAFNICMKVPIILVDVAVGYLLYILIQEETGNDRKALCGAVLWLFCPTIVYMSGIQAQFDSISALFMLLTIMLARKDRTYLAGMVFATGVLLKFFPAFTILVLIFYTLVKHREDGTGVRKLLESIVGAVIVALVIYAPVIAAGDVSTSLSFVTGRTDRFTALTGIFNDILIAIALIGLVLCGYLMRRSTPETADRDFITYSFLALAGAMFMSVTPQYMIVMLPLLITVMMRDDGRMRLPWILLSFGSFMSALANNNFMLLDGAWAYLGITSADQIVDWSQAFESNFDFIGAINSAICHFGQLLEYLGLIAIVLFYAQKVIGDRIPHISAFLDKVKRWDCEREEIR